MSQLQDAIDAAVDGVVRGKHFEVTAPENLVLTRNIVIFECDFAIDHITHDTALTGTGPPIFSASPREYAIAFDTCVFSRSGEWSKGAEFDEQEFNEVWHRGVLK